MSESFQLVCEPRTDQGKGASRRLRHADKVPGVIYGAGKEPQSVQIGHNELFHHCENEAFFSHLLTVIVDGEEQEAIMKDLQRHPFKQKLMHFDLLRVKRGQKLRVTVPLHVIGEATSPGIKSGGVVARTMTDVEMNVLPRELPEYIEVDVSALEIGGAVHLSQLSLPESAELVAFQGDTEEERAEHDQTVVHIVEPRVEEIIEDDEDTTAADEVPTTDEGADDTEAADKGEDKGDE